MSTQDVRTTLQKAAEIIRARGWVQNTGEADDGACCAVRAISIASTTGGLAQQVSDRAVFCRAVGLVRSCLPSPDPGIYSNLVRWNDEPGRTVEEVLALLEKASQCAVE